MSFMVDKNIAHPFQGVFTKGKRGTDHILVANTLIDQARHMGHPLYAAFIDLQKAYDSVCRPLLFRKMVSSGLGPKFCQLIENMYANASSCIKLGTALGTPFSFKVGLRQGDPLSPLLFNLFVADLIFAFTNRCDPPILHNLVVPSIQFADDICNFSSSESGNRASIECTLQYCTANRLKVNLNKSCFTVFNDPQSNKADIVIEGLRCSSHRLDIELGRHSGIPRSDRKCRFCSSAALGNEYHAFKCPAFLDLQVFCDISVSSKPQFITLMTDFPITAQRYITLLTSLSNYDRSTPPPPPTNQQL